MLIREVADLSTDSTLADAQEIGAQLQTAMEDLYYAHRMGNPNPTVKQNIDMLQKSIRSFNQELNALGYKYAPTVPGLVARMGTRFVEDELSEGPFVQRIVHPGRVTVYVRNGPRPPAIIATDIPYEILDRYIEKIMQKYPQFKPTDFSFKSSDKVKEGFRVAAPQIRGTQNRAQSAYYPTNVKPRVPKLDKPLSDQELARLSQLAGIKSNK